MKSYRERTDAVLEKVDEYNEANDTAVENGDGTLAVKRGKKITLWTAFIAACLALLIGLNLFLFLPFPPPPDISAYENSEYYGLITVVNKITYKKPEYKNNFEKLMAGLSSMFSGCGSKGDDMMFPANDGEANGIYTETTNNQVESVTEGDLLKRSTKYAYYLTATDNKKATDLTLLIYGLEGGNAPLVSSFKITCDKSTVFGATPELYLSKDCNTVTVVSKYYNKKTERTNTLIISLDVSDVKNVKETARICISGSYISSRMTDGTLLVFTNFITADRPDFSKEDQFLPSAGTFGNMKSLPAENIIYDEDAISARYTVACAIDEKTLEINSAYAFLSFSEEVCVSEDNVFLTRSASEKYDQEKAVHHQWYTEITRLSYADGTLEYVNKAEVPGTVLNQYSMDEYDGILRVVTEDYCWGTDLDYYGASLYCIDLESFEICASYERFSPDRESIYSVRFDNATAYVCTAMVRIDYNTDPVYAIDLSDIENIKSKDTGTITGYSISLMKFKYDTLIGIGYGERSDELKIELYTETENGVKSVACYSLSCSFSDKFKAYYLDAEHGLIGISVLNSKTHKYEYLLLRFDGYELTLVQTVDLGSYADNDCTRTAYADGYIYVFTKNYDGGKANVIDWNS